MKNNGRQPADSPAELLKDECPCKKFAQNGPDGLSDPEILAISFKDGACAENLDAARKLIRTFDSLAGIESATISDIQRIAGIDQHMAVSLKASIELGRRVSESSTRNGARALSTSRDVAGVYMPRMKDLKKEVFKVALLNTKNRLLKTVTIAEGGLSCALVYPRDVFNPAVRESANSVIVVHNHPSGDPEPSLEDIRLTERIKQAGEILGISLLDHLIIGDNRYYSFVDEGMMD